MPNWGLKENHAQCIVSFSHGHQIYQKNIDVMHLNHMRDLVKSMRLPFGHDSMHHSLWANIGQLPEGLQNATE
jgi:hypothetical protein